MPEQRIKIRKNITIKKYQEDWLNKHPEFNLSGLIQEVLDKIMSDTKSVDTYVDMLTGKP